MAGGSGTVPGPPNLPGQTTIQVRVPYRVVGLVVGPKGATIKRIQQQTHTYIVTPSRDKEPVFEVTGMPENVDRAREEIEAHIAMRTGGLIELTDENDFHANGTDVGFDLHGHSLWSKPTSNNSSTTPSSTRKPFSNYRNDSSSSLGSASTDSYFGNNSSSRMADYSPPSPALSYTASNNGNNVNINVNTNGNEFVYGSEVISPDSTDLTFESSPGFDPTPAPPGLLWSQYERGVVPAGGGNTNNANSNANNPPIYPANASTNANAGMMANQRRAAANGVGCTIQPRLSPPLHH